MGPRGRRMDTLPWWNEATRCSETFVSYYVYSKSPNFESGLKVQPNILTNNHSHVALIVTPRIFDITEITQLRHGYTWQYRSYHICHKYLAQVRQCSEKQNMPF